MPNTTPHSPALSQNPSTCPEDSAPTTAWLQDDEDDSHHHNRRAGPWPPSPQQPPRDAERSPSPTASMPDFTPTTVMTIVDDSSSTSRSTTLSPDASVTTQSTPARDIPCSGASTDPDSVLCSERERGKAAGDAECACAGGPRGDGPPAELDKGLDFRDDFAREDGYSALSMGADYPNLRAITVSPSSYLRAGTKFRGTQQSERQVYDVSVEIKHVDLRDSFLCGYLRIQDLTEDHPTLTTYFEGEIIGQKHTFTTPHPTWGATSKDDLSHWSKFAAFRPYARAARKGPVFVRDLAQQEHIFMRWKEQFLVPDHRVTTIRGASFEGFYYICFNQVKGQVSGIYFHAKSERFQQLELVHVEDRGCFAAVEFR